LPQVACFDTAFHRTAPEVDQAFALPYAFFEEGIRRYGFHGLSYEYIASVLPERAPEIANGRVVVAHLGNGCSACAMRDRVSLAAALGGLDGIVFTAGVGENAAPVRSAICRACAWLGLELDEAANREHKDRISTSKSRVAAYVIKTDENLMIARHARTLVGG